MKNVIMFFLMLERLLDIEAGSLRTLGGEGGGGYLLHHWQMFVTGETWFHCDIKAMISISYQCKRWSVSKTMSSLSFHF